MEATSNIQRSRGPVEVRLRVAELQRRLWELGREETRLYRELTGTIEEATAVRAALDRAVTS